MDKVSSRLYTKATIICQTFIITVTVASFSEATNGISVLESARKLQACAELNQLPLEDIIINIAAEPLINTQKGNYDTSVYVWEGLICTLT